jgi:hypothetical protein
MAGVAQMKAHMKVFAEGLLRFQSKLGVFALLAIFGAPQADLWPKWQKHDPASAQTIDHSAWDKWLKKYLVAPHPSGVNRVRYGSVGPEDRKAAKELSGRSPKLAGFRTQSSGAKGVLDQSLQRTDGGGDRVPVCG